MSAGTTCPCSYGLTLMREMEKRGGAIGREKRRGRGRERGGVMGRERERKGRGYREGEEMRKWERKGREKSTYGTKWKWGAET